MPLHLIRHGETAENARRILQLPDVPLSERGIAQAHALAARLAGAGITRVLASDLRRAVMTAELVAETTGAALALEPLLQERNFGTLRGRPYAELEIDPFTPGYEPPGGESEAAFLARVEQAWLRVRAFVAAAPGPVAVISHGLVCRAFVAHHLELPAGMRPTAGDWRNTALTVADPAPPWRVRLLACTAHLEAEAAAGASA